MQLRPYQTATETFVLQAWADPALAAKLGRPPRVLVVAPTGAGKTEMARAILGHSRMPLALVHTKVLRKQTAKRVPNVLVMTLQGIVKAGKAGDKRRALLSRHDVCFIDEAHHVAAGEWRQAIELLEAAGVRIFGATATPERGDGTPLGDVFDTMHVAAQYSQLLADGHLCRCDVMRSELSRKEQRKQKVRPDGIALYLESARRDDGSWRPGIYFDQTIPKCREAVERFNAAGVRAKLVCCDTDETERQATFDAYSRGELDMLASPMALTEGFDAPRAEVCVLRRMCESIATYLQACGRVLRPYTESHVAAAVEYWRKQGKEVQHAALVPKAKALLIDCGGASEPNVHGLPTNDRLYSLEGKGISAVPEEEPEEEPEIKRERELWEERQTQYVVIRDTLRARYEDLCREAQAAGFKDGWVFHRFKEATSIEPPRMYPARYRSVCVGCRKRVQLEEKIFWTGPQQVYHCACWFSAIDEGTLARVPAELPPVPAVRREWRASHSAPPAGRFEEDNIPF